MQVMLKTWNGGQPAAPFNNAAQVVNHTFFFESMKPNGGGEPGSGGAGRQLCCAVLLLMHAAQQQWQAWQGHGMAGRQAYRAAVPDIQFG
jgi:hypothetical protein